MCFVFLCACAVGGILWGVVRFYVCFVYVLYQYLVSFLRIVAYCVLFFCDFCVLLLRRDNDG